MMKYEQAKTYLESVRKCRLQINRLELCIIRVRTEMENPLGNIAQGERVQTSAVNSFEAKMVRYLDLLGKHETAYAKAKEAYEEKLYQAESMIMLLPDGRVKEFLLAYYIDGMSELDFGVAMGYETTGSVYNLKRRAIRTFATNFTMVIE